MKTTDLSNVNSSVLVVIWDFVQSKQGIIQSNIRVYLPFVVTYFNSAEHVFICSYPLVPPLSLFCIQQLFLYVVNYNAH